MFNKPRLNLYSQYVLSSGETYIKTICSKFKTSLSFGFHCTALRLPSSLIWIVQPRYMVEYIEVKDSVSEEELVEISCDLCMDLCATASKSTNSQVLAKYYGIAAAYCCDLVQRIKIELEIYCQDRRHLSLVCSKTI